MNTQHPEQQSNHTGLMKTNKRRKFYVQSTKRMNIFYMAHQYSHDI